MSSSKLLSEHLSSIKEDCAANRDRERGSRAKVAAAGGGGFFLDPVGGIYDDG